MTNRDIKHLEEEYRGIHSLAGQFSLVLRDQLMQLLAERRIHLGCPIEWRVKTWQSLLEKFNRKSLKIVSIKDSTDLIGIRLVLLFRRDVQSTCELIEKQFKVLSSEDTAKRLSDEQFGYGSVHYVAELPKSWLDVPTLKAFDGLKAEIQVRTLAQHMWAAASHALQYKREAGVPPPLRRAIHRASALLETIDLEFERVLIEKDAYKETLTEATEAEILNVDSLERLLDDLLPAKNKDEFNSEDYADLLSDLVRNGITTPEKLRQLLMKHRAGIIKADKDRVKEGPNDIYPYDEIARIRRGVFYTHVGLTREALSLEFENWRAPQELLPSRRTVKSKGTEKPS